MTTYLDLTVVIDPGEGGVYNVRVDSSEGQDPLAYLHGVGQIVPGLEKNLKGVRAAYEAGSAKVAFADILLAEQSLNTAKLRLADIYRELWRAVADLEGLMQLDLDEPLTVPELIKKR